MTLYRSIMAAFLASWAASAEAAQITVQSVTGTWQPVSVVATRDGDADITGSGTSVIRWGESFPGYDGRSGFAFSGVENRGPFEDGKLFDVGVFTHMNRVIYQGEHVDVAQLDLTVAAAFDGMTRTFQTSYRFSLWETPNLADPCGNGAANGVPGTVNRNGCGDRVQLLKNDSLRDVFEHNGMTYQFELFGFASGQNFWTVEDMDNTSPLRARFWVEGQPASPVTPPPSDPSPIPLPATAWLMLGGLLGMGVVRRFKNPRAWRCPSIRSA